MIYFFIVEKIVMKKIILLFLFLSTLAFFTYQDAGALTINAVPQKQVFGPNDWIKINIKINEYNGQPVKWIAHLPDGSVENGTVVMQRDITIHQIIRDAFDNEFGLWSIDYKIDDVVQTVNFKIDSLNLTASTDKELYYEPDTMKINLTSALYNPNAKLAQIFHLTFYDNEGNLIRDISEIEIKALQSSMVYNFPLLQFANSEPPGLYKLKIKYYNSVIELPFLLGDINNLMEISAYSNTDTYLHDDPVNLDLIFTRIKESTGILTITTPSGNTTDQQFRVDSVHTQLVLKNLTTELGKYNYEIKYAGAITTGSFNVIPNPNELQNIVLEIFLDKLNYRPGETINLKVYTSDIIANSISIWVVNPAGIESTKISLPIVSNETVIPYKTNKDDSMGLWKLYVKYGGIVRDSSFNLAGLPIRNQDGLNAKQYNIPKFVSFINSTTFKFPTSITVDSDNSIYVVDSGNSKIKKFDSNGSLVLSWGGKGEAIGKFTHPFSIFVNKKFVYVTDTGNSKINMFTKDGNFVYSWGSYGDNPGMFHIPVSIGSDQSGQLFIADSDRSVIQTFDIQGTYIDEIHPILTEGASFSGISSLAFDSKNNFYAVSINNAILEYSAIGNFLNFYGSLGSEVGRFNNPSSIAIDSRNNFYVADTMNHRIQKFDSNGNFLLSWGVEGQAAGQFEEPVSLAIDSSDNMYIVDKKNNNVQKFALYSSLSKIAVPSSIRDTGLWWSEGLVDRNDFDQSIRVLINQDLIRPTLIKENNQTSIPDWIKGSSRMWALGQIDDDTYLMFIQYLISNGIMKI